MPSDIWVFYSFSSNDKPFWDPVGKLQEGWVSIRLKDKVPEQGLTESRVGSAER